MAEPNYKTLGDAVGMPDAQDRYFIRKLLLRYERSHPGVIKYTIDSAKADQQNNSGGVKDITEFGLVDKHSDRRHIFELPESLVTEIEKYYPTMFREKKHFRWFVKNFKELMLPDRY